MNELICEMCGSNDVIKDEGLFICQSCGTKYSVNEARRMMSGETVSIEGTVKIDSSSELNNLYEVARRAKDSNNAENAINYYSQILSKDPNSWEAQFYTVYFRSLNCKLGEITIAASNLSQNIDPALRLIKNSGTDPYNQKESVREIYDRLHSISQMLYKATEDSFADMSAEMQRRFCNDIVAKATSITKIYYTFGDKVVEIFGDKYKNIATQSWKNGVAMHTDFFHLIDNKKQNRLIVNQYVDKIKINDPSYKRPLEKRGRGCYIATSVYGSYDCPEVWTLRRFRDNILYNHILGRLFIKTYYATSPTLVKYFGDYKIFNKIFKPMLDSFVKKLNEKGVESTYYVDEV